MHVATFHRTPLRVSGSENRARAYAVGQASASVANLAEDPMSTIADDGFRPFKWTRTGKLVFVHEDREQFTGWEVLPAAELPDE